VVAPSASGVCKKPEVDVPRVYVILLNWNGWRDTIECLESVLRLDYLAFQVVICDNQSEDGSLDRIKDWAAGATEAASQTPALASLSQPPIQKPITWVAYGRAAAEAGGAPEDAGKLVLVQNGGNIGFAAGNNVAIRYMMARGDGDFVWLLNNDTVVGPRALTHLVARATEPDRPGITGSTLRYYSVPDRVQALGGASFNAWRALGTQLGAGEKFLPVPALRAKAIEQCMSYVIGASMLVSRAFLADVGLMEEDYFLYFEELDWAERGRRVAGQRRYGLGYAPESFVYHKVGASIGSESRSLFVVRYLYVNQLRFMKRFYPRRLLLTRALLAMEALIAAKKRKWAEARLLFSFVLMSVSV